MNLNIDICLSDSPSNQISVKEFLWGQNFVI